MRRSSILLNVASVLLGVLLGSIIIFGADFLDQALFPLPPGVNPRDPSALKAAMAHIPVGAFVVVLIGWIIGTFSGALVAARIARRYKVRCGMLVGVLFWGAGIANMLEIPHPLWFWVVGVAIFLPAAYLGTKLAARHSSTGRISSQTSFG